MPMLLTAYAEGLGIVRLIDMGEEIPNTRSFIIPTTTDNQTSITLWLFSGQAAPNDLFGELIFTGIKKMPLGMASLHLSVDINQNGIATFIARLNNSENPPSKIFIDIVGGSSARHNQCMPKESDINLASAHDERKSPTGQIKSINQSKAKTIEEPETADNSATRHEHGPSWRGQTQAPPANELPQRSDAQNYLKTIIKEAIAEAMAALRDQPRASENPSTRTAAPPDKQAREKATQICERLYFSSPTERDAALRKITALFSDQRNNATFDAILRQTENELTWDTLNSMITLRELWDDSEEWWVKLVRGKFVPLPDGRSKLNWTLARDICETRRDMPVDQMIDELWFHEWKEKASASGYPDEFLKFVWKKIQDLKDD
jgi:hypothetical protein